jgi:hypothetical protein
MCKVPHAKEPQMTQDELRALRTGDIVRPSGSQVTFVITVNFG